MLKCVHDFPFDWCGICKYESFSELDAMADRWLKSWKKRNS